ncbi:MAG: histone, partial [Betaproteobacteria bacterium]|nr:histone [Betaproteobacteria bacterium]
AVAKPEKAAVAKPAVKKASKAAAKPAVTRAAPSWPFPTGDKP